MSDDKAKFMSNCLNSGKTMDECTKQFNTQQARVKFNQALTKLNCPAKVISAIFHAIYEMDQKDFSLHATTTTYTPSAQAQLKDLNAKLIVSDWWQQIMKDLNNESVEYIKDLEAINQSSRDENEHLKILELAQRGNEETVDRSMLPRAYAAGRLRTLRETLERQIEPFRIKLEAFYEAEQEMGILTDLTTTDHLTGKLSPNKPTAPILKMDKYGRVKIDSQGNLRSVDWQEPSGNMSAGR